MEINVFKGSIMRYTYVETVDASKCDLFIGVNPRDVKTKNGRTYVIIHEEEEYKKDALLIQTGEHEYMEYKKGNKLCTKVIKSNITPKVGKKFVDERKIEKYTTIDIDTIKNGKKLVYGNNKEMSKK